MARLHGGRGSILVNAVEINLDDWWLHFHPGSVVYLQTTPKIQVITPKPMKLFPNPENRNEYFFGTFQPDGFVTGCTRYPLPSDVETEPHADEYAE